MDGADKGGWDPSDLTRIRELYAHDLYVMDGAALRALAEQAEAYYRFVAAQEPPEEDEESYAAWEEQLEALDDLLDDISDLTEES